MGSPTLPKLPAPGGPLEPPSPWPGFGQWTRFLATVGTIPPADKYVTADDQLRVVIVTSLAQNWLMFARILRFDGDVYVQREVFTTTGVRGQETFSKPLAEGFLLSVDIAPGAATSPLRGQAWVQLSILRNLGQGAQSTVGLAAGYCSFNGTVSWPVQTAEYPQRGPGASLDISVSNPAVGADWSVVIPTGAVWVVQAVTAQLVTAVAAANRFPHLQFMDGANVVYDNVVSGAIAASLTVRCTWAAGDTRQALVDNTLQASLVQNMRLFPMTIRVATTALQPADQWQNIRLYVQEYETGAG